MLSSTGTSQTLSAFFCARVTEQSLLHFRDAQPDRIEHLNSGAQRSGEHLVGPV